MRYSETAKKQALALAFGVVMTGSVISGIPGNVNGLSRALSCGNCTMRLNKGLPSQFAAVMTDEQKKVFKQSLRRKK